MKKQNFYRFGSPTPPHGALYIAQNREGMIQAFTDVQINMLRLMGIRITPLLVRMVEDYNRKKQDETDREIDAEGISEKFIKLFEIKKKSEVRRYCKNLKLTEDELFFLCHNSLQIGFERCSKFPEYVPEHLKLQRSDISTLIKKNPKKLSKIIHQVFVDRRRICVQLFQKGEQWHCFYYSYQDMESTDKSHWQCGSHVHYVSYLWPNYTKKTIWKSFDVRSTNIADSIHIKLIPSARVDDS